MRHLLLFLALVTTGVAVGAEAPGRRVPTIPAKQIIDASPLQRSSAEQVLIGVFAQAGGGLFTFYLDRKPIAQLGRSQGILLYLGPGTHRFGVIPSSRTVLHTVWETKVEITKQSAGEVYRIFQSSGFTSSGGNAVFEIDLMKGAAVLSH